MPPAHRPSRPDGGRTLASAVAQALAVALSLLSSTGCRAPGSTLGPGPGVDAARPIDAAVPGGDDLGGGVHPAPDAAPLHLDASHGRDGPVVCAADCPGCAMNEDCFVSDYTAAVCLSRCATTSDCPPGFQCAELVTDPADVGSLPPPYSLSARLCFSTAARLPPVCARFPLDSHCQLDDEPGCFDGQTLRQAVVAPGSCGYEYLSCLKGCVAATSDGGMAHKAHCR